MIIGVFIRHFKVYKNINYIPLTTSHNLSGLIGKNGIGKSSILEALDSFFNGRDWNINLQSKKGGQGESHSPYIVPIFLIAKSEVDDQELTDAFERITNMIMQDKVVGTAKEASDRFYDHIQELQNKVVNPDDYFIVPIGIIKTDNKAYCGIFDGDIDKRLAPIGVNELKTKILAFIQKKYQYVYIPKEIDTETYMRLENTELTRILGFALEKDITESIAEDVIDQINRKLTSYLDNIKGSMDDQYQYKTSNEFRETKLRRSDLTKLIIQNYFSLRKLHKINKAQWLDIVLLSSGEKQKALLDVIDYLMPERMNHNLILAIDEPENSLHISACFEQFEKIYKISKKCCQLLFCSHWYGFLPILQKGCVSVISRDDKDDDLRYAHLIDLYHYREQIKQISKTHNNSDESLVPLDIQLKSISDLVQTIITSIVDGDPYCWLICEGSSEKIYFEGLLKDVIDKNKLRIIPMGGANSVINLHKNLIINAQDFKKDLSGKVLFLYDTDDPFVDYDYNKNNDIPNIQIKRLAKNDKRIYLVDPCSETKMPVEIEDCLDPTIFEQTIATFIDQSENLSNISFSIDSENKNLPIEEAFDFKPSEKSNLDDFFNETGIKYRFAQEYISNNTLHSAKHLWIDEIKQFFMCDQEGKNKFKFSSLK